MWYTDVVMVCVFFQFNCWKVIVDTKEFTRTSHTKKCMGYINRHTKKKTFKLFDITGLRIVMLKTFTGFPICDGRNKM